MKRSREEKAYKLFCAIGDIDAHLAAQALEYKPQRRTKPKFAAMLAACLCIALMFVAVNSIILKMSEDSNGSGDLAGNDGASSDTVPTLDSILQSNSEHYEMLFADDIDLFSGKVQLIWQNNAEDGYRVMYLNQNDAKKIKNLIVSNDGERLDGNASDPEFRVWIAYGDGTVVSPHLNYSAGNIGYGEIFEYDPEKIPSQSFTDCVKSIFG